MTAAEFAELFVKHAHDVTKFAAWKFSGGLKKLGLEAEDAVSATYERLAKDEKYLARATANSEPGRAPTWLVKAVENTGFDMLRGAKNHLATNAKHVWTEVAAGRIGLGREWLDDDDGDRGDSQTSVAVQTTVRDDAEDIATEIDVDDVLDRLAQIDLVAREAAVLVYRDGLTWTEAAKGLGTGKADALRMRVHRAFGRVREELRIREEPE